MKKIIYIFIIILFLFNILFVNFCFSNNDYELSSSKTLNKMGIIVGDENGDLMLNKNLTRAEFATIIIRLLEKENEQTPTTNLIFNDVDTTFWGYSYIYKCVSYAYLIGDGNGYFRPNDIIKYEEVLTIMLRILNKEKDLHNWPDDYILKSEELKITENVNLNKGDVISRGNACIIIYNCLIIEI